MREKDMGIWQSYTWADYYDLVKYLALSFIQMGLEPGDRVCIVGENKPHVYWFELAVLSARGTVIGVFSDCTPPEIEYYVGHSQSKFVVCQDQEQVDKLLQVENSIPTVEKIIYWDAKGLWSYNHSLLMNMGQMLDIGEALEETNPTLFEDSVSRTQEEDIAVFFYTSGTTGRPKAGMVSHKSLIGMGKALGDLDRYNEDDEYVSFLPVAWLLEQLMGVTCSMLYGLQVNFPEKPETVQENIREIGPQVVFFGPRLWENIIRTIQMKMNDANWLQRLSYRIAMQLGYWSADMRSSGKKVSPGLSLLSFLAYIIALRTLRDNLGLAKTRVAYTAGSAISPDVIRYLRAVGVNIKQLYGSSEVGVITCHRDEHIKAETCGAPLPGVEVKISPEGEILVRTPNMFAGYFGDEAKTKSVFEGGFYRTGDFGFLDEQGQLIVMDRLDDVVTFSDGKKFSPQYCETRLRFSPYIKDVLVVGRETADFVAALIDIDLNNVGQWAESRGLPYTTYADLSQKPQVIDLIKREIAKVNETMPQYSRIKKFVNLQKEFDPDEAEMTRTRKLRRGFVEERLKAITDGVFGSEEEIQLTSQVTYRDGRVGTTNYVMKVISI